MTQRVNISLSTDTLEHLDQYAFENHKSRSQVITDYVWSLKTKNQVLRSQMHIEGVSLKKIEHVVYSRGRQIARLAVRRRQKSYLYKERCPSFPRYTGKPDSLCPSLAGI